MIQTIIFITAVYVVVWWITLFAVLPWGVQSQQEKGRIVRGSERGAPAKSLMWKKLGVTTVIATILVAIGYSLSYTGFYDRYVLPPQYVADRLH